jgi:hypothetical protein
MDCAVKPRNDASRIDLIEKYSAPSSNRAAKGVVK